MTAVLERPRHIARRFSAAVDSSTSGVQPADRVALPADLLDGGEIVLLAMRPSLWFLVFDSARWILFGGVLLVLSAAGSIRLGGLTPKIVAELACVLIAARLAVAMLRWVSRFYVLTNRRVMRLRGVFRADVCSCLLLDVRNTRVSQGVHERAARLGTLEFISDKLEGLDPHWYNIAKPDEVHAQVRRAIERAIDNQPHG